MVRLPPAAVVRPPEGTTDRTNHREEKEISCATCDQADARGTHAEEASGLVDLFLASLDERKIKHKPLTTQTRVRWERDFELMHRIDGLPWGHIVMCIRWLTADPFWSTVILSPAKVRKHYEQMSAQARASKGPRRGAAAGLAAVEEFRQREGL
jgi:hypothetical protein